MTSSESLPSRTENAHIHREDPDMPTTTTALPVDPSSAGCWIEGSWGHYAAMRLCEIAESLGWPIDPESKALVANYADATSEDSETVYELADEAEEWLNDNAAPEGYGFGWADGEFMLWPLSVWMEG